jgi:hypothetical protein
MRIPRHWLLGVATALAVVIPAQLRAQVTTAAISGIVVNEQNQPLEGVQVQVVNASTSARTGTLTRADGRYYVQGLELGDRYSVTARRIGYAPHTVAPVRVTLGQATPVNFTLSSRVTTLEAVTVQASAAGSLISPTQKGSSTTITDTLLRKLPTLNRNFTDFVTLTPQVSTSGPGLSAAGANNRYNNIQIDGATEKDLFGLGSTGQPGGQAGGKSISLESVREYQVLLAPYDVRVGNFSGLSVNAVTKSGTNEFTGSAYVYGRSQNFQRTQPYINQSQQKQYGLSLGGPILRDKAFFFINPEWQDKSVPASGFALGDAGSNVTQATLDQFTAQLAARGMAELGTGDRVSNKNPLTNIFARVDFALPYNSTLVLRNNYAHAEQDVFSRGSSGATPSFALTSNLYHFVSDKQAPVVQLRTNLNGGAFNELIAGYTRIRDKRATPGVLQPQVTTFVTGVASLVAGTEAASQANQLDQDITELTDNFTFPLGSAHRVTIGTQNQWYKVRNLFGNNSVGTWTFGSLDSLTNGTPRQYQVSVPVTGDGAVRFRAGQFAGYLQDDWTATPNFNMSFGVRFDVPVFFDKPPRNDTIAAPITANPATSGFARNTADVPSGKIQFSPRIGFNWDVTGDSRNQLRGGVGVFQGSPAYVWLGNSFQNSGGVSGFASLNCSTPARSPAFTAAAVASAPTACSDGTRATAGAEVNLLNADLKFPQTLRGNLAFDHDLGNGYIAGVEGLYTRWINTLFYYNLALQDAPVGTGLDGRSTYGTLPNTPTLKVTGRNAVYDVINESKDYSYSLTGSLQKRFTSNFGGQVAYTFTQAYDVQSLTSSTAGSQYRFGRVYSGDQRDLTLSHSAFETPHRIIANASYTFASRTSLSTIYTGQSGLRYAYVSSNDLNGDNQTLNDPIYIPTGPTDPKGPVFATTQAFGGVTYTPAQQAAAFDSYISSNDCLNSQRGTIMQRNSCTTPWTNQIDVSVEQAFPTLHGQNFSVRLDVINFGNLLNKRWGRQITTSNLNPITIYTASGMVLPGTTTAGTLLNGVPRVTFDPTFNPYNYDNVFSNYTMQLSARYSF